MIITAPQVKVTRRYKNNNALLLVKEWVKQN